MGLYSRTVEALTDRIQAHVESGLLTGWNFRRELAAEVEGKSSLPWLRFNGATVTEEYSHQEIVRGRLEIGLVVATAMNLGLPGLLEAVERIADAIETTTDGTMDLSLGGAVMGVSIRLQNMFATPLALHQNMIVEMKEPRALRGLRHQ